MRDIVDCCPEAESYCGEDRPRAEARGCEVYVGNNLIAKFNPMSDDYAYTNAVNYAKMWNKKEGLE